MECYQNINKFIPSNETLYNLGEVHRMMGEMDQAKEYFKKLIENDANFLPAWKSIGDIYYKLNCISKALKFYQQAVEKGLQSIEVLNQIANCQYLSNNHEQAISSFKEILKRPDFQDYANAHEVQ